MTRFTQTITVDGKTATDTYNFRGGVNQAIRAIKMQSRANLSIHFAKLRKEGRVEHSHNGFHVVWTLEEVDDTSDGTNPGPPIVDELSDV